MKFRIGRLIGYALIGLLVVPVLVMFIVLGLAHLFEPSCGTPGDSGGCEMGAVSIGIISAIPAMLVGIAISLWIDWRSGSR